MNSLGMLVKYPSKVPGFLVLVESESCLICDKMLANVIAGSKYLLVCWRRADGLSTFSKCVDCVRIFLDHFRIKL